jgi:hypothetical protein
MDKGQRSESVSELLLLETPPSLSLSIDTVWLCKYLFAIAREASSDIF